LQRAKLTDDPRRGDFGERPVERSQGCSHGARYFMHPAAEVLLKGAMHPIEYRVLSSAQASPPHRLADEPTYVAARRIAPELQGSSGPGAASFRALALRSATIGVANKALKSGSRLEDLAFTPPLVTLDGFSFLSPPSRAKRRPGWRPW
jgi:hypothetical protein